MAFTVVSLHAHPDDESLLTGGTLTRAAGEGHRVVLVVATDGSAGLTSDGLRTDLGRTRMRELETAAERLGVARIVMLGYPDGAFSSAGLDKPAADVARVLDHESADVLTGYDEHGGYGHPDHVHVHHVARLAASLAQPPVLLEATVDRTWLVRGARLAKLLPRTGGIDPAQLSGCYLPREELTHRVRVAAQVEAKVAALTAHASQMDGGADLRTVRLLASLPQPIRRAVLGREWFREVGREPGHMLLDDPFASLR